MSTIQDLARMICHGGESTLFCHRCTGVWAGAALALPLLAFDGRKRPLWLTLLASAAFLQMPILGWGHVLLSEWAKTLSGQAFSTAAVIAMGTFLSRRWRVLAQRRAAMKDGGGGGAAEPGNNSLPRGEGALPVRIVFFEAVAGIAVLQALIRIDAPIAATVLDILSLAGLCVAALLVLATALLATGSQIEHFRRK